MKSRRSLTPEQALLQMADICSRSEHSSREIREKLLKKGLTIPHTEEIVKKLIENNFIDDNRFAKAFVSDKIRFGLWGRNKIRMGLFAKGIDAHTVQEALENIDLKEYGQALLRAARNRAKNLDLEDYDSRMKLYRALASKGFESQYITKVINYLRK